MTIRPHVLAEFVVFGLMILTAFGGLVYAWLRVRTKLLKEKLPLWRRTLASIGLIAVSVQALLFFLPLTRIGRDPLLFGRWASWQDPIFFIAVLCVLAGKGSFRWWLLSSSILLFVISFLVTLTA
jgi:hypothetical protein